MHKEICFEMIKINFQNLIVCNTENRDYFFKKSSLNFLINNKTTSATFIRCGTPVILMLINFKIIFKIEYPIYLFPLLPSDLISKYLVF